MKSQSKSKQFYKKEIDQHILKSVWEYNDPRVSKTTYKKEYWITSIYDFKTLKSYSN